MVRRQRTGNLHAGRRKWSNWRGRDDWQFRLRCCTTERNSTICRSIQCASSELREQSTAGREPAESRAELRQSDGGQRQAEDQKQAEVAAAVIRGTGE